MPSALRVISLCALLWCACSKGKPDAAATDVAPFTREGARVLVPEASPLRQQLAITPAEKRVVRTQTLAPATVEADPSKLARIYPPLAGRVTALHVQFGQTVAKGQPLFTINAPDLVAAQSDYQRARASLQQADRTLARQKDLTANKIGAQRDVEQAETDRALAVAELDRATVRLRVLGSDPGQLGRPLVVRSPVPGRVIDLAVGLGEFRNDPNAALMTVADLSQVWLTASVQERDLRRVQQGDEALASFAAYPGESFKGKVLFVGDLLDPDTRTVKVRVAFPNPKTRLKPGMFATVTFSSVPEADVVIPTTALLLEGNKSYVLVQTAAGAFEKRFVDPGDQVGDVTVIARGLDKDEPVVTKNAVLLQ
ncbi:MAG: efflux RND transporter periplasmic adaptor subunit [Deltaproteobacteria bacterium]|nr:efflux RND transporter periplasmic adaptor subunit [Deltaproteobacteria bacterium]